MDFRNKTFRDEIEDIVINKLENIKIDGDILVLRVPFTMRKETINILGEIFSDVLKNIDIKVPVIMLPNDVGISSLNEEDMKQLGWKRITNDRD